MSRTIRLHVPAIPVGQPRVRATIRGNHAGVYTPPTVGKGASKKPHPIHAFKATIKLVAAQHYTDPPIRGAVRVDVLCVFPRQAAKVWKTRPMPRYPHITKPDRDNIDKAVLDALKGIVIVDDCAVCGGTIEKCHAAGDEQPHVVIVITPMEERIESRQKELC